MRVLLAVSITAVAFAAAAQSTARPRPAGAIPLDDVPPPPSLVQNAQDDKDTALEPQLVRREQVVEENRTRGRLYAQRVTTRGGRTYVLADHKSDGSLTKLDNSIDGHLSVPQWVLMEF